MDFHKYYIFDNREAAQAFVNVLTEAYAAGIPYTEVRPSNNGQGYAVRADDFTATATNEPPQDLPANFYAAENE